jgi:hypothetical protein
MRNVPSTISRPRSTHAGSLPADSAVGDAAVTCFPVDQVDRALDDDRSIALCDHGLASSCSRCDVPIQLHLTARGRELLADLRLQALVDECPHKLVARRGRLTCLRGCGFERGLSRGSGPALVDWKH